METPLAYKVSDKSDKLFRVIIDISVFRLKFIEVERGGKLVLEYKARMDGARIYNFSTLSVPRLLYNAAKSQAYAIRGDQR